MNPVLLGDEMFQWSDAAVARGAAFGSLVARAGGRTLVAGPHHPDLIAQVPADGLTLLVRGVDDRFWTLFGDQFTVYGNCTVNIGAVDDPKLIAAIFFFTSSA